MNAQTRDLTEESLMEGILPEALAALKQPTGEAEGQRNGTSRKPDPPSPYPGLQGKGGKILLDTVESWDHKIGGPPDEPQPWRTQSLSDAGTEVLTLASPSLARSPGYLSVEVIFAGPGAGGHGWKGWGWGVVIRELKLSIGLLFLKMEIAVLSMWRCCEDEE